jgi:hypothetical protein
MHKNKLTDGVFAPMIGSNDPQNFLLLDEELGIKSSPELKKCTDLYEKLLIKNKEDLETLAKLEDTITKIRCKEVAKKEFKLSQTRGYIYARTPFFRNGKDIKDIRVIVGKKVDWKQSIGNYGSAGEYIDTLFGDKKFVILAKEKLQAAMTEQIKENMLFVNSLEEKIFSV